MFTKYEICRMKARELVINVGVLTNDFKLNFFL